MTIIVPIRPASAGMFPKTMTDLVTKLPLPDADRDMLAMKILSKRQEVERLGKLVAGNGASACDDVTGVFESVNMLTMADRHARQDMELFWLEQALIRNDILRVQRSGM